MHPPSDIERGDPYHRVAPNKSLPKEPVSRTAYRQDSKSASHLLVYRQDSADTDITLEESVLQRVCREVREKPQRLPLAAHRLGGLVNAGRLPWQRTWDALYHSAIDAGAGEAWVRRCLFAGFAESNVSELPTPMLWALVTGGVE